MKKLTIMTLLMTMFLVVSCGDDKKKKKNHDLVISGLVSPQNCQPIQNGQQLPQDVMIQVYQACMQQRNINYPLFQQRLAANQPINFSLTYIQPAYQQNPYGTQPYPGQQYPSQQFMGQGQIQVTGISFH